MSNSFNKRGERRLRRNELINPYYTQSRRSRGCGYRHQGPVKWIEKRRGYDDADDFYYCLNKSSAGRVEQNTRHSADHLSKLHRSLNISSCNSERNYDQSSLNFPASSAGSAALRGENSWYDIVEQEELQAEKRGTEAEDFQMEDVWCFHRQCHENADSTEGQNPIGLKSSLHRRKDSQLSNTGSWSSATSDSSKNLKKMSATPSYTSSELQTNDVQIILSRRKKQIEYGKTQDCYKQYLQLVPRRKRTKFHPQTPDIHRKYSRRGFDTLVRIWKKQLHAWEPNESECSKSNKLGSTCESSVTTNTVSESVDFRKQIRDGELNNSYCGYDAEFPPLCSSAIFKIEPEDKVPDDLSADVQLEVYSNPWTRGCNTISDVIKTEKPDDSFQL